MLRKTRRTLAVLCFVAISLLFLDFTGTLHGWLSWLAKVQFMPAVLALNVVAVAGLLLLTLLFGRAYCAFLCPLGVFQDLVSWVAGRRKKNRFSHLPAQSALRYGVLVLFAVSIAAGVGSVFALLEPYGAFGRMMSTLGGPVYVSGNNVLAWLAARVDSYAFYRVEVVQRGASMVVVTLATLAIIVVLSWKYGRLYCNTVCPVGTMLGFASRFALFKHRIDAASCSSCGHCARNCKASCIDPASKTIDYSRCVMCMNCTEKCPRKAISFRAPARPAPRVAGGPPALDAVHASRRQALSIVAVLATSSAAHAQNRPTKKIETGDGGLAVVPNKRIPPRQTPIIPAGARSIQNFERRCTGCQLCVSVCPSQILRASNRAAHVAQPELSFERGYCRPECTKCSEVCPSGAIHRVTAAQKSAIQFGHAVWKPDLCVITVDNVACDSCARHCPPGAIRMAPRDPANPSSPKFPIIDVERCTGCGACEYLCPSRPLSAIRIEGHERHRMI